MVTLADRYVFRAEGVAMVGRRGFRVLSVLRASVLAAGLVLAAATATAAPQPSFRGLGNPPGQSSWALAVSADGTVAVGRSEFPSSGGGGVPALNGSAFRWTAAGGMVSLQQGPPWPLLDTEAHGVSADGAVVVGGGYTPSGMQAFRWTEADGVVPLGYLPGGVTEGCALGVSEDGAVVVGYSGSSKSYYPEAFRWTAAGGMEGLGYLSGASSLSSRALAVTPDGSVVVGASRSAEGTQAFRWTRETGMVGLGDLAGGGFYSEALGVSADGRVVVGWSETVLGLREAFRWTQESGMVRLGESESGQSGSTACGVSSDGQVVVGGSEAVLGGAFFWTEARGMQSLQELLADELGLDLAGWRLGYATAISPDGFTIVGAGTNPDGRYEAWIATIPEPGALSLLALGAVALLKRRNVTVEHP